MKPLPVELVHELEQRFPKLAEVIRRSHYVHLYFEDFGEDPDLMFYWACYAQELGLRVVCRPRNDDFPHMPRNEARILARLWPELALTIKRDRESVVWFQLELFESDPDLFWAAAWYVNSRGILVQVPWPQHADRYPLLPPPKDRQHSISRLMMNLSCVRL